MSYEGYFSIARAYDSINKDIDYSSWADFFESCFERYSAKKPKLILDLACGTGRMTAEMSKRGYDMIGVDGSVDMLSEAYFAGGEGILYLCQDMRELELYGTVSATLCCLDSLNYLTGDGELEKVFSLVHNYSDPDALFMFDVNTPYKFEKVYADNAYLFEGEDAEGKEFFCGWQNFYDKENKLCNFYLTVFEKGESDEYLRSDEQQCERCYSVSEISELLAKTGFELEGVFSDFDFSEMREDSERAYFVARVKK